jgi:thiol-disulfide isomerase/thioredoxin
VTGLYVAAAALAAASVLGLFWRRRNGSLRTGGGVRLTAAEIGGDLGERATLVQFSSAFCAPCRATRRVLIEVAGMVEGVTHVEIDAESHLDLVRRLGVLRTPTVLILDPSGTVVRQASGLPRKPDVLAALPEPEKAPRLRG